MFTSNSKNTLPIYFFQKSKVGFVYVKLIPIPKNKLCKHLPLAKTRALYQTLENILHV